MRNGRSWCPTSACCRRAQAGAFEAAAHKLRAVRHVAVGRNAGPTAAVIDGRTLQSSPENGGRAGHDGVKRRLNTLALFIGKAHDRHS